MKKLAVLFIIGLCVACTSDSENNTTNVVITGYKITSQHSPDDKYIRVGNLFNNKLFSETREYYHFEDLTEQLTDQKYFYNPNGTLNHFRRSLDNSTTNLYYDDNGNLIAAKLFFEGEMGGGELNARFTYHSETEIYYERLTLAFDNPATTVINRIILQLNANDDVVSAGVDSNFDGVMENRNAFEYSNGNLTAIHYYNGVTENYQYSSIIDNFKILTLNSFGKRNLIVLTGECFAYLDQFNTINFSKNILQDISQESVYQVLPNNFYQLKTETTGSSTTITQFFFN